MNTKCILFVLISLTAIDRSQAQTLDPSFGNGGIAETYFGQYVDSKVHDMLLQPDGKIVVCGTTYVNSYDFMMIRYLENGTLDSSFGESGKAFIDFDNLNNYGLAYALQADGKIVVVGHSTTPNYESISIARINDDGTIDTSFGDNGIIYQTTGSYECYGNDVVIQPDGKILVAGKGIYPPQGEDFFLARYHADGSLDTSFDGDGKVENINDLSSGAQPVITLQNDGKILLSGMGGVAGQQHYCTMRFLDNGSLDNTFSDDGIQLTLIPGDYNWPGNIVIQPDQKIVIAGYSGPWQFEQFSIIRLDANGNLDSDFASAGIFTHSINQGLDLLNDVLIQPDGKILACGYTINPNDGYDFVAMRLNEDGSIDNDFGENGVLNQTFSFSESRAVAMAIQPDGKLLIAGDSPDFTNYHTAIARYDAGIPASIPNQLSKGQDIQIYPNPTSSHIQIDLANGSIIDQLYIYDIKGKLIEITLAKHPSNQFDVSQLQTGIYSIYIVNKHGQTFKARFIKE
ncbi:MAG: T9SS type A sorting domain-containing protein [Flavobacteriales bacterium]|nr:T9SS type A sorting domain-containing protein [Flavobacteriales bacterium]